jgi:RES domain-containing protein
MLIFRIGHKKYAQTLTASGVAGRWAAAGKKVIYGADSVALAMLESMIRRQGVGFNNDFKIVMIEVPDDIAIKTINIATLKGDWRDFSDYSICQKIGNTWYDDQQQCILKVPSAVITTSFNYVINTLHPDFNRVKIFGITDLVPDKRIEDLLKSYHKK